MRRSNSPVVASLLLAAATLAAPAMGSAAVNVDIEVAPPAPRVEPAPPPRAGFVWAPGYWRWRHGAHVWVGGHWIAARRGRHYVPEQWVKAGPRWHFKPGHWERG